MMASNRIRAYFFLAEIFKNRGKDPLCRECKAFVNSVNKTREHLAAFGTGYSGDMAAFPAEFRQILSSAKSTLAGMVLPENVPGQKKAGNCKMPQGVCFVKHPLAILDNLEPGQDRQTA